MLAELALSEAEQDLDLAESVNRDLATLGLAEPETWQHLIYCLFVCCYLFSDELCVVRFKWTI